MRVNLCYDHFDHGKTVREIVSPDNFIIPHSTNNDTGKNSTVEAKIESYGNKALKITLPVATAYSMLKNGSLALASTGGTVTATAGLGSIGERLLPLIHMVQDLALPVGIVMASWGVVEIIMGNIVSGKEKIKWSLIGYVSLFVLPEVFYMIKDGFRGGIS